MIEPTLRQRETLYAIAKLHRRLGRAPSIAELGEELDLSRPYAVRSVLDKLERDGLVTVPRMRVEGELGLTAAGKRWL